MEVVFGYEQADIHRELHELLDRERHAAASFPRGHGKTDQVSVGRAAWEIGRNPDLRIKVFKNTDGEAKKSVDAVRRVITSEKYRAIFPNVRPDPEHWTGPSFRVLRPSVHEKEPTYQGYGIMGSYTGGRADILICDDICDLKNSVQRPADRENIKESWRTSIYPMIGGEHAKHIYIYTPYHVSDCTAEWERTMPLIRRAVVGTKSPWPKQFPPKLMSEIRNHIKSRAYARAYELKRVSDAEILIRAEWLDRAVYKGKVPAGDMKIVSADPAYTKPRLGGLPRKQEPDWSVAVAAVVDENCNAWIYDVYRDQTTYPEFKAELQRRYSDADLFLWEDVAAQRGLAQDLAYSTPLIVRPMAPAEGTQGGYDKRGRLASVSPLIESGKLHLLAHRADGELVIDESQRQLYDELTTFPVCGTDDCVDAVSQLLREVNRRYGRGKYDAEAKVEIPKQHPDYFNRSGQGPGQGDKLFSR